MGPQPCASPPSLFLCRFSPGPHGTAAVRTAALTLPLISLAICSSVPILPTFSLTSDKKLGDIPLVGVSSVPDSCFPASPAGVHMGCFGV